MNNKYTDNGPMLNAYPDSIGGTLGDIVSFLEKPELKDVFQSFYILPSIFNTDLDRGFSVIDYNINEELGSKEDIERIKKLGVDLKLDFILNHASVLSPQFQDLFRDDIQDHRILSTAMWVRDQHPGQFVALVTKDINLRLKAKAAGMEAQDYLRGRVDDEVMDSLEREVVMVEEASSEAVQRLAYLFGGAEVLDEAETLLGRSDGAIEHLRSLYQALNAAGYGQFIRFDLGMVHPIDYYTGVIFRGYVEGAGNAVLSGGQYDNLCAAFGRSAEAIGFAVDVDAVAACLPAVEVPRVETVIHYEPSLLARALALVDSLPQGSSELSPCMKLESTLNLAREKCIGTVLVLDQDGERTISMETEKGGRDR
jgi:hypothetical protein